VIHETETEPEKKKHKNLYIKQTKI